MIRSHRRRMVCGGGYRVEPGNRKISARPKKLFFSYGEYRESEIKVKNETSHEGKSHLEDFIEKKKRERFLNDLDCLPTNIVYTPH